MPYGSPRGEEAMHSPTVGSQEGAVSYERGTSVAADVALSPDISRICLLALGVFPQRESHPAEFS